VFSVIFVVIIFFARNTYRSHMRGKPLNAC